MIGLTVGFKRARGRMAFRDAFVAFVVMIFAATLGCLCLTGVQPDESTSQAENVAASASRSHVDQMQGFTGTCDILTPAASGGAFGEPHRCCIDERTRDSAKSEQGIRLLAPGMDAVAPDAATDAPASHSPAASTFHTKAVVVKPPSLVHLSISRT